MNDLVLEQMEICMKFLNLAMDKQEINDKKNAFEYLRNAEQTLSQAIRLRKRTLYRGDE
tara:strand:- start:3041 stop:3217 length:177 start_codon:yes stop_codon:yes gene_type:complete